MAGHKREYIQLYRALLQSKASMSDKQQLAYLESQVYHTQFFLCVSVLTVSHTALFVSLK